MVPLNNGSFIQELFGHIQNPVYLGIFKTMVNSEPWHTQNHSEPWHIQQPGIFRTLTYSEFEAHSEPCQTSTMQRFAKVVNGYNYFHRISFHVLYLMK